MYETFAFKDNVFNIAAIYSRSLERAKTFAAKYNVNQVYTDFESMSKGIEAVYIASPNALHAPQALFFLEKGVYTIYPMVVLFGPPYSIKATGHMLSSGVDGSGSALFGYDGMTAVVDYSKTSHSTACVEIQGEEGSLILDRINRPRHLTFIPINGSPQNLTVPHCGNDYYYEIKEFLDLIESHQLEHPINSHTHSLMVMEVMDEIRRQLGLTFPADRCYCR